MIRFVTQRFWPAFSETLVRWNKNDGFNLAAAMAYYGALSFFPALLLLTSGIGFVLKFYPDAKNSALETIISFVKGHSSDDLANQVDKMLTGIADGATVQSSIGLLTLLIGAIGIFTQLSASFDRIWHENSPQRHGVLGAVLNALGYRLKAFASLVGLGVLVLAGFAASLVLEAIRDEVFTGVRDWHWVEVLASMGLNMIAFSVLYKVVPRAPVRIVHAIAGGVFVAVVWELGRQLLSFFIIKGNYQTAYGAIGSFIAVMLWVYYASLLLFMGAQLVQVLGYPRDTRAG